jgi:hypothetical protein
MKLNPISARVLAAGVASFGVLTGVLVAANPASAATPTHLCLNNVLADRCIYASGPNHAELADASTPGITNWTYPASVGATAAIKQANVNLCLQLDYARLNNRSRVGPNRSGEPVSPVHVDLPDLVCWRLSQVDGQ